MRKIAGAFVIVMLSLLLGACKPTDTGSVLDDDDLRQNVISDEIIGASNAAYQKIKEYLEKTYDGKYPSWYGGCIIGDDGRLVVQLTKDSTKVRTEILAATENNPITFTTVKNSYQNLKEEYDHWVIILQSKANSGELGEAVRYLTEVTIDEATNVVRLGLSNMENSVQNILREHALRQELICFSKGSAIVLD